MRKKHRITLLIISLIIFFGPGCKTPSILVNQEQQKGDASFNAHDYEAAIGHYSAMLDASSGLGIYRNLSMEADVHRKLANCHEMLGRYPGALEQIRSAAILDSIENNPLDRIEDLRQEGMVYLYMGNYTTGIHTLETSLELNEGMDESLKNTNRLSIADTYLALGKAESALGRFGESLENLNKCNQLYRAARSEPGVMESLLAMGKVYLDLGDPDLARSSLENSRDIAEKIRMSTARHEQSLAIVESSLGFYENALRHQERALEQAEEYKIAGQIIWFTIGMGDIYREIGDLERAERYYREAGTMKDTLAMKSASMQASVDLRQGRLTDALDYFTAAGSRVGAGISSLRMGEIYLLKEQYDSALASYNLAAGWFRKAGNTMGFARSKLHLGQIYVDLDKLPEAEEALDSAEIAGDFPENLWQIWLHRGRMLEKAERPEEARKAYEESIRIIENIRGNLSIEEFKSTYLNNKREVYERLINLLERMGNSADAFNYSERARARTFLDVLANKKIDFRGSEASELIRAEQDKRFEIRNMYRLLQSRKLAESNVTGARHVDTRMIYEELRNAQDEYQEILLQIKLNLPDYSQLVNIEPADIEKIRHSLDEQTAIIAYWISEQEVHSWLIGRDDFQHHQVSLGRRQIQEMVEAIRRNISSYHKTGMDPALTDLYGYLMQPLESGLTGYTDLVIVPNGPLHFLPFQTLVSGQNKYLVEDFNISYAPSTSVYLKCNARSRNADSGFLGMALGDLSIGEFSGLPGTEQEVAGICNEFTNASRIYMADSCTETVLKNESPGFRYIHLATHGSYNYFQPLYSFLLFNPSEEDDGRLTVHEVFELSLNSNLVTLSACETGLGNIDRGDELEGLSRAFIYAGSSSVIVSLWSVADYQTSVLMSEFYSRLKDHPAVEALALAQKDLLKRFPQPFYWAPFILIGNEKFSMK